MSVRWRPLGGEKKVWCKAILRYSKLNNSRPTGTTQLLAQLITMFEFWVRKKKTLHSLTRHAEPHKKCSIRYSSLNRSVSTPNAICIWSNKMHKILVIRLYFILDALHVSIYFSPSSGANLWAVHRIWYLPIRLAATQLTQSETCRASNRK